MTEPTDAEIIALNAGEIHFSESPTKYPEAGHGTQYRAGAPGVLSFARAVLAKWGTPAPVGVEPVAHIQRTHLQQAMRGAFLCRVTKDAAPDREPLYTADQVLAMGRVPLTEAEANVLWAQCLTKYKRPGPAELIREFCNGGKGGQHGADI